MWDLDDWKDVAEVVKNFADTALALVAALALLRWDSRRKKEKLAERRGSSPDDADKAAF